MRTRPAGLNSLRAPAQLESGTLVELTHELSRCHRLLRVWLQDRLRPWKIRDTEFLVLWLCDRFAAQGVVQHELAAAVGVSEAQMSGLVERLRQNGLLVGCRGEPDRRRQYWRLTAEGTDLLARVRAAVNEWPAGTLASCLLPDQRALLQLVQKLAHDLADADATGGEGPSAAAGRLAKEADDELSHRRAS
jgi:DNA-binding MarR family transcriptional regulator